MQEIEQQPNRPLTPAPKGQLLSSCVPFTGPYKEKESLLYLAITTLCLHPTPMLPTSPSCGFWRCCDWLSHIVDKNVTEPSRMFHYYQIHF